MREYKVTVQGVVVTVRQDDDGKFIKPAIVRDWESQGTALKPAYEPIILAMNPLDGTFANNALKHEVAGLNIDECRVGVDGGGTHCSNRDEDGKCLGHPNRSGTAFGLTYHTEEGNELQGRFPANFLHDGSEEVMELFPQTGKSSIRPPTGKPLFAVADDNRAVKWNANSVMDTTVRGLSDNGGSAARFFYTAKASKSERGVANNHPTVKPLALMEYLCKLVKMPEYNLILDPFMGSGTTLLACKKQGIRAIGIDSDEKSCEIAAIRYLKTQVETVA